MGSLIVESNSVSTHSEEFVLAIDIKDSKKKKRRPRKSKSTLSACSSMSEICTDVSTSSCHVVSNGHHHHQPPYMEHANERIIDANLQNEHENTVFCNSIPEPAVLIPRPIDYHSRRTYFPPHWPADAVNRALEKGELLRAIFRVNVYNRLEAYCKIDGVQTDVLINGVVAQNRAIEGDTVAIVLDPPSLWPRMKGSSETPNNSNEVLTHARDYAGGKDKSNPEFNNLDDVDSYENMSSSGATLDNNGYINGYDPMSLLENLSALITLYPTKRPTGKVISVIEKSTRRETVVGFLKIKQWIYGRESRKKKNRSHSDLSQGFILLTPTDPKFTKMTVPVRSLPEALKERLEANDLTIESDLVAAKIVDWAENCYIPDACIVRIFGRGSDVEAQISAILFENAIDSSEFSSEVTSCLPPRIHLPREEFESRKDLRDLCVFTIDPSSATDLDDALSVEKLPNGVFRVGVHIADVSYFVPPDTALDLEARIRSTSVYLLKRKLSMLPPMLSDNLASLNPGVDRLAFSIFWDLDSECGEVLGRWIGRTIIRSCSKLSYEHAQGIIDGGTDQSAKVYGPYEWIDVINSVKCLHEISKILRENRFRNGALSLESPKIIFLYDEDGVPYDSLVSSGQTDSNFLVEEFMLLANKTAAEVITRSYPSRALLRRHPEPNARKLKEFEAFCNKHGLQLDISSSANLHRSLERIRGELELKNDSVLFDIMMSYAARPMQLASYFCLGDFEDAGDYCHYALDVPLYTHFTSPLRRYPDIVVHRTLAAVLEAEDIYATRKMMMSGSRCFSGVRFDKDEMESVEAREALSLAASKYGVPGTGTLADVAAHCNERKLATRHVKDAIDKVYMWVLLKKKEVLHCEARVLGLGPKFMSIYIPKLVMERRIYYDEVDGLTSEWLDTTSTLVLSRSSTQNRSIRKSSPGKSKTVEETALVVSPAELNLDMNSDMINNEPIFFPLTVRLLSTIPVALHAVGGDDGPIDIVARLYISSYFSLT